MPYCEISLLGGYRQAFIESSFSDWRALMKGQSPLSDTITQPSRGRGNSGNSSIHSKGRGQEGETTIGRTEIRDQDPIKSPL